MDLVDERTRAPLKRGFMSRHLYQGLVRQGVVFNKTFEDQTREEKLRGLCQVFGVEATDPDDSYELTYDNIMKMLAITTRFRANIPVVMMGETGREGFTYDIHTGGGTQKKQTFGCSLNM